MLKGCNNSPATSALPPHQNLSRHLEPSLGERSKGAAGSANERRNQRVGWSYTQRKILIGKANWTVAPLGDRVEMKSLWVSVNGSRLNFWVLERKNRKEVEQQKAKAAMRFLANMVPFYIFLTSVSGSRWKVWILFSFCESEYIFPSRLTWCEDFWVKAKVIAQSALGNLDYFLKPLHLVKTLQRIWCIQLIWLLSNCFGSFAGINLLLLKLWIYLGFRVMRL